MHPRRFHENSLINIELKYIIESRSRGGDLDFTANTIHFLLNRWRATGAREITTVDLIGFPPYCVADLPTISD